MCRTGCRINRLGLFDGSGPDCEWTGNFVQRAAGIAAWAEAGQISLYTLLVWGPAVIAAPKTRLPWTAFFVSWIIGAAAGVVAQNVAGTRTERTGSQSGARRDESCSRLQRE